MALEENKGSHDCVQRCSGNSLDTGQDFRRDRGSGRGKKESDIDPRVDRSGSNNKETVSEEKREYYILGG